MVLSGSCRGEFNYLHFFQLLEAALIPWFTAPYHLTSAPMATVLFCLTLPPAPYKDPCEKWTHLGNYSGFSYS